MNILNPNKKYYQLFKDVDALNILLYLCDEDNKTITLANFFKFRELLFNKFLDFDKELSENMFKKRKLYLVETTFGIYWILSMMRDIYDIDIIFKEKGYNISLNENYYGHY